MAKITATIELRKEFMVVFAEFRGCPIYIYILLQDHDELCAHA